jgi:hypothetical protein
VLDPLCVFPAALALGANAADDPSETVVDTAFIKFISPDLSKILIAQNLTLIAKYF